MADFVAEVVLDKLASAAFQEIRLASELKSDLEKLKGSLLNIKGVLLDAEEMEVAESKHHQLSAWLRQLKDAFYGAENVVDEFECEALRRQVVKTHGSTFRKVHRYLSGSNPLVFRFRLSHKIRNMRERLEEIAKNKNNFHVNTASNKGIIQRQDSKPMSEYSQLPGIEVIGRDDDKEKIIYKLMQEDDHDGGNYILSVIPIVGIGGIGKSTLVKLVYNDVRVYTRFDMRMWVHVSQDFSVTKLTKTILNCAMNDAVGEGLSLSQLRKRLQSILTGKRVLLILDDVWNIDRGKWIELKSFLTVADRKSKIIVTTCNYSVASIMGTVETYTLKPLSLEDCFSLFMASAFRNEQEANQYPHLKEIGKQIVGKCGGVPLAARNLGCLLFGKNDASVWKFLRDNDIWALEENDHDTFSGLRSRYNQMPSYLKQCFVYSSFYPKGYKMNAVTLIQLWMALEALQLLPTRTQELEDIGEAHFKELCARSFLQTTDASSIWDVIHHSCEMNDIIHDLSFSITKDERSILFYSTYASDTTARHLSFCKHDIGTLKNFEKENNARTVIVSHERKGPSTIIDKSFIFACISRFKYLRVFDLSHSSFEELPSSIGDLKHLRYLDLSGNHKIKKLPNSICNLQCLQALLLGGCKELEQLPKDLRKLISLRFFMVTTKGTCLSDAIGHLESLRFLGIIECCNLTSLLNDMKDLNKLRTLLIAKCEKMDLTSKSNQAVRFISLQRLTLCDLPSMIALPQWLQGNADTLEELYIERCPNLATLPEWLPNFKSLKILVLRDCPKLSSLPEETQRLTTSMKMQVENCPCLVLDKQRTASCVTTISFI